MSDIDALTNDLLDIHRLCGLEVTYRTEAGDIRPYWPNRYLQALRRAIQAGPDAVVAFAARFVEGARPRRGFGHLQAAGRLDLTVEALVADPRKPYHHLFPGSAVAAAASRLADAGFRRTRGAG